MSALHGPVGVSTAVTVSALVIVAVLVDRRAPRWLSIVLGLVALAGFSIEGHTRASERRLVMVASDIVHLVAASVWLGGIVALVVAFRSSIDTGSLARIIRRFSDSAILAVAVVAVTGVTMAWIILPSAGELTSTGYGLALIVKVALVVAIVGLGAFNRYRLVPAVDAREHAPETDSPSSGGTRRWLSHVVLAELVLLLAAVGVTSVMVTRSPLSSVAAASPDSAASQSVKVTLTDNGTADATVTPGRVGFNVVDVELRDLEGRIVNPYDAPVVEFALPALDVGPLQPEVLPLGIGRYQATANLGFAGTWDLSIRVRISEFESVAGSTTVTIE